MSSFYRTDDVAGQRTSYEEEMEDRNPLLGTVVEDPNESFHIDSTNRKNATSTTWLGSITETWSPIDSMRHSFNPSIEGLRSIAASLTMLCHIMESPEWFREAAGTMGVTIFFVLSGFLITAVLIRKQSKSRTTFGHLPRFYTDRFFRLGPALFLVVAIIYPLQRRSGTEMAYINRGAILALTYLSNITSFRYRSNSSGPWPNTWSLACEEQYYIFWAIALPSIVARATTTRVIILSSLISISVFIRIYSSMYPGEVLFGTEWHVALSPNIWKMLLGSSLRLVPVPPWLLQRRFAYLALLGLTLTLAMTLAPQPDYGQIAPGWNDFVRPISNWTDFLSGFFTAMLLCGVSGPGKGLGLLELQPLRFLGRVSYSWYLWQVPLMVLNHSPRGYRVLGDTAIALVVATCSTLYVEEPINKAYKSWVAQRESLPTSSS